MHRDDATGRAGLGSMVGLTCLDGTTGLARHGLLTARGTLLRTMGGGLRDGAKQGQRQRQDRPHSAHSPGGTAIEPGGGSSHRRSVKRGMPVRQATAARASGLAPGNQALGSDGTFTFRSWSWETVRLGVQRALQQA